MTPSSVLSAGSVPDTVLENCRAAEARSWWLTGISGAEAAAGACPAQAETPLANTVPLSRTAINRLRVIYGSFRTFIVGVEVGCGAPFHRSAGWSGAATEGGKGWPSASRIA